MPRQIPTAQFKAQTGDQKSCRNRPGHSPINPTLAEAPVDVETLLKARRSEDEGADLWHAMNRVQESLIRGGVSDWHRDKGGKLRTVRALRRIDSKVSLNKEHWELAERVANGEPLSSSQSIVLAT